jgi:hypothetical protein
MKTLQEYQKEKWEAFENSKRTNMGIECPNCKEELHRKNWTVLSSYPGQIEVKCLKCGYETNVLE